MASDEHGDRPEWAVVQPLLEKCIELPGAERAAYLEEACGPDTAAYVLRLLEAEDRAGDLLVPPGSTDLAGPRAGSRVGAWRLVERIGEGGMGVVWRGERADGAFEKRVAIKLLKAGMRLSALQQRFATEIQVLASLDHPTIARFYDGGRTDDGVPFLVLEFVDGDPIDRWCDRKRLGLSERIELFLQVCNGVQHAHEHGVLHRDLKPGNVLVGADGVPRLLDFGIARVIGQIEGVETVEMTRTGQRLYSPRYASPEQVRGENTSATSDVYSLGVMLYELLTGRPPYPLTKISQFELERAALETDAIRPSRAVLHPRAETGFEDVEGRPTWALRGLQDNREHQKSLTGDLDWILLAALRKEPGHRYGTVADFAEDLRRHLEHLPVHARPESRAYRARRFVRRNRTLVGSSLTVLLALVTGLILALVSSSRATRASEESRRMAYRSALSAAVMGLDSGSVLTAVTTLEEQPEELRAWEWHHLRSRSDRSIAFYPDVVSNSEGCGIALLQDGRWAAIGHDRDIRWIDLESGAVRASEPLEPGELISSLSAPIDGSVLVVGTLSGHLVTLDPTTGELERTDKATQHAVYGIAHSPVGDVLAYADYTGVVTFLDAATRTEIDRWKAHDRGEVSLHYSPDGTRLATTSWDGTAKIWDARTRELLATCAGHEQWVTDAAWSSSGSRLATSSVDGTVAVWDAVTGELNDSHHLHRGLVTSLVWLPGDEDLVSAGFDGEVLRWNADTGERLAVFLGHRREVASVAVDAKRGRIITAGADGARIWDIETSDVPTGEAGLYATLLSVSPDGERVVCSGPDGILRFFTAAGKEIARRAVDLPQGTQRRGRNFALCWVREDLALLSLEPRGYVLRHPDLVGGELFLGECPDESYRLGLAWAPATQQLALLAAFHNQLLRLPEGERVRLEFEGQATVTARASVISPDGELLATTGIDGLHLWALPSGSHLKQISSVNQAGLAFGLDGSTLYCGSLEGVQVHQLLNDSAPRTIPGARLAEGLAHHPTEPRLAVGHEDGRVTLVDTERNESLMTLGRHGGPVPSLAFTPDGGTLVTLGTDGTIKFWSTD